MRIWIALLFALLGVAPAAAQNTSYFVDVPGYTLGTVNTPITRPNNTTAYSANVTVCQSASATCTPGTAAIANRVNGGGFINSVSLFKSGSSTTSATFTVWMYSAAPTLTSPAQQDTTSYTGPRTADGPNFLGSATCGTATATSDTSAGVWYECTLSNPNTSGARVFQTTGPAPSVIYFLISVTAAYTPAANETFTPYFSGFY